MAIPSQTISQMTTLVGSNSNDNCFFTLYNDLISGSANQNLKARISTHEQFYSNNNTIVNQGNYNNYFGTGKDGSVTISSSAQISSSTSPGGLNNISREHGDIIVKNFQNLTINSGVLFSPLRPCRGLLIYCTGNLTVNGTISMTGKGGGVANKIAAPIGIASSTDSRYDLVDATLYFNNCSSSVAGGRGIPTHWNWAPSGSAWFSNFKIRVPLSGSVAGGAGAPTTGPAGTAGIFCCGAGGAGGSNNPAGSPGGSGGRGTIFTGGGGGGGGGHFPSGGTGASGAIEAGGLGGGPSGGGGAGNPQGLAGAGSPVVGTAGTNGVGGLLILIVRGNVTINGTLSSNGSNGGTGGAFPPGSAGAGGGGGSGGGRIMVIYGGTYSNVGTIVANGGSGGVGGTGPSSTGFTGGAGGAGSTTIRRVHI
jgi:hypothetical protein